MRVRARVSRTAEVAKVVPSTRAREERLETQQTQRSYTRARACERETGGAKDHKVHVRTGQTSVLAEM